MEYQLHYSLVGRYSIKQGIIFATQVPELLQKLSVEVSQQYNDPINHQRRNINQLTADNSFLQAMESFYRGEYANARHEFSTLLTRQNDNLTAKRFLLKTLVALGEYAPAQQLGNTILSQALAKNDRQNYLRTTFELGLLASHQQQFKLASGLLSQSRDLAEENGDTLYIAYAHTELGVLMTHNKQWDQANELFQSALLYHQGFQCPYGQIDNLQALANVEQQQANLQSSLQYFNKALSIAEDNALYYHQVHLLLSKINISRDNGQRKLWLTQAKQIVAHTGEPGLQRYLQTQLTNSNLTL
jgi:tetratricopeptide (TPR) repeat protein